jgi:hypothetical protein
MLLVEHDNIVETRTTDTANDPLTVRMLPWTVWRNLHFFDAPVLDALLKMLTVDGGPVPEEISWCGSAGKRLDDLLSRPLGGGVCGLLWRSWVVLAWRSG